jgi:hypothetical protein
MNPHGSALVIFDKGEKTYNGGKTPFLTNVAGKTGYVLAEN